MARGWRSNTWWWSHSVWPWLHKTLNYYTRGCVDIESDHTATHCTGPQISWRQTCIKMSQAIDVTIDVRTMLITTFHIWRTLSQSLGRAASAEEVNVNKRLIQGYIALVLSRWIYGEDWERRLFISDKDVQIRIKIQITFLDSMLSSLFPWRFSSSEKCYCFV